MAVVSFQILALENALLRSSFEATRTGICVIDSNGIAVTMTSLFSRCTGIDFDTLLGQPMTILKKALAVRADWDLITRTDQVEISTEAVSNSDAQKRPLLLEARTVEHSGDQFRLLTLIDFMEFGVNRNESMAFQRQSDELSSSIVIADANKFDLPIVFANAHFFTTTGYRASEVLGRNCRMLQGPQTEPDKVERIREALKCQRPVSLVITNYRKDGTPFENELTISPMFDETGRLTHFGATQRILARLEPQISPQLGA